MSLEAFKSSGAGVRIAAILAEPSDVALMEQKSREGRPAVEAIGARIAVEVGSLDHDQRKLVGRWVKQVLVPRGWVPDRKGRVRPGQLFARGTIYRRAGAKKSENGLSEAVRPSGAERLAAARAILVTMPHPVMSSEELIADRRRAFAAGE